MTEIMKPGKKKQDEVWAVYQDILSKSPSPLDEVTKHLVFVWMYFFAQEEYDRKEFSKRLLSAEINPLDISFFIEEVEKKKTKLKKNVLPIKYVSA